MVVQEIKDRMVLAGEQLTEVVRVVDQGQVGSVVVIPLEIAPLVFRLSRETLDQLRAEDHQLRITVNETSVVVNLSGGPASRREGYTFFYGLLQSAAYEQADVFLEAHRPPDTLLEEIPELEEVIGVFEDGGGLPPEDMARLHIFLTALHLSLDNNEDLERPENVFTSLP